MAVLVVGCPLTDIVPTCSAFVQIKALLASELYSPKAHIFAQCSVSHLAPKTRVSLRATRVHSHRPSLFGRSRRFPFADQGPGLRRCGVCKFWEALPGGTCGRGRQPGTIGNMTPTPYADSRVCSSMHLAGAVYLYV